MADHIQIAVDLAVKYRRQAERMAAIWEETAVEWGLNWTPLDPAFLVPYFSALSMKDMGNAMVETVKRKGELNPAYFVGGLRNMARGD